MTRADETSDLVTHVLEQVHAAIYASGVIGAQLDDRPRAVVRASDNDRRRLRDDLVGFLRARDVTPPAARPAYALVGSVAGAKAAVTTARLYSDSLSQTCLEAIGTLADTGLRDRLARWLVTEATHATELALVTDLPPESATEAFPGRRPVASASPEPTQLS